jgi:hypothetical protein
MQDKLAFVQLLTGLAEVMGAELSEAKISIYESVLDRYTDEQVARAINVAAESLRFFPKPVELIEFIDGKPEEAATMAWGNLLSVIQRQGVYQSIVFEDPKIAHCVEMMGGWSEVCNWRVDETSMRGSQFLKLYKGCPSMLPNKKLSGLAELHPSNAPFKHLIPPPILIGRNGQILPEGSIQIESVISRDRLRIEKMMDEEGVGEVGQIVEKLGDELSKHDRKPKYRES